MTIQQNQRMNPWGQGGEYRNFALPQSNMYGNPYGWQQSGGWGQQQIPPDIQQTSYPTRHPQQQLFPQSPAGVASNPNANRPYNINPNITYDSQGRPGPPPAMQAPHRWQRQGLGMFDWRVTNPLLRNDMRSQGLTEQGQAARELAENQNQQRQDEWTQAIQRQNAMARANLATTGLDSGEHERLQRDVRREGLLGQQQIGQQFDDRMLQLKMQDEAIKRENTNKLMGLSASAAQMEVPWSRQDDIWAGATANENAMAQWRHAMQGWIEDQARKRDEEWMNRYWSDKDKNRLNESRLQDQRNRSATLEAERQRRHELDLNRRNRDHEAWLRRNFPEQFGGAV